LSRHRFSAKAQAHRAVARLIGRDNTTRRHSMRDAPTGRVRADPRRTRRRGGEGRVNLPPGSSQWPANTSAGTTVASDETLRRLSDKPPRFRGKPRSAGPPGERSRDTLIAVFGRQSRGRRGMTMTHGRSVACRTSAASSSKNTGSSPRMTTSRQPHRLGPEPALRAIHTAGGMSSRRSKEATTSLASSRMTPLCFVP